MNSNNSNSTEPVASRRRRWPVVLLVAAVCLGWLAVGVSGFFRVGRDAGALRDSLLQSATTPWTKTIEVSVGSFTCSLARLVTAFFDMPPEARAAIRAARGAEVAVYEQPAREVCSNQADMLLEADRVMENRGWDRMAGVISHNEMVVIYLPKKLRSPRDLRLCLAVLERGQLVVVSARSNLEPLLDFALKRCAEEAAGHQSAEKHFGAVFHKSHLSRHSRHASPGPEAPDDSQPPIPAAEGLESRL